VAWIASRNGRHLPTLLDRLLLDADMGEMVISVSMFESWSIRASSFTTGSCSVTKVMIRSMVVMKNSWKQVEMACNWCTIELQLKNGGRTKVLMVQHSK
jgi:hypothetical protein